ncbi:MAG: hypothetical protein ABFS19_07100, partial [Thermodesulfobacteriota bacterium]
MASKHDRLRVESVLKDSSTSFINKYRELVIGDGTFAELFKYEFVTFFFSNLGGALGLGCRKLFFPGLFRSVGKNVLFGRGITLRAPGKVSIGSYVMFDDFVTLSVRGTDENSIQIDDNVLIGPGVDLKTRLG